MRPGRQVSIFKAVVPASGVSEDARCRLQVSLAEIPPEGVLHPKTTLIPLEFRDIGFVSYFSLWFIVNAGICGFPHNGGWVKYLPLPAPRKLLIKRSVRAMALGTVPAFSHTLTRAAPERSVPVCRSRDLLGRYELHPSATPGPNDSQAVRYASGQESQCLRDQFDPVLGLKRPPGGAKRRPSSPWRKCTSRKIGYSQPIRFGLSASFRGPEWCVSPPQRSSDPPVAESGKNTRVIPPRLRFLGPVPEYGTEGG